MPDVDNPNDREQELDNPLVLALALPGETWAQFAERLQTTRDRWETFQKFVRDERIHDRECSQLRRDGLRCRGWAVPGSDRCNVHLQERLTPPITPLDPCRATRRDGNPCRGRAYREGLCFFHWDRVDQQRWRAGITGPSRHPR